MITSVFDTALIFLVITAALSYFNKRFIGLPTTIGVMAISIVLSLIAIITGFFGFEDLRQFEKILISQLNFSDLLLDGMLSMLLFAGALHINLADLRSFKWVISLLAIVGTVLSMLIIAALLYYIVPLFGVKLDFIWCLLFGALISPTDPIAVMGILNSSDAPQSIKTVISGESLFNDGIGVVIFVLLVGVLNSGNTPSAGDALMLFITEAGGGLLFGAVLGAVMLYMVKTIDGPHEEVLITLAGVLGGYALATHWHLSGPLAMVVVGLMLGNHGREHAMSEKTRDYLDLFWELIDEILNAMLFVLIGLEIIMVDFDATLAMLGVVAIVISLLSRTVVVGTITKVFRQELYLPKRAWQVLVWGGLRGGISVALVLYLPAGEERNFILGMTYAVVIFSILVQGLTIGKVANHMQKANPIN